MSNICHLKIIQCSSLVCDDFFRIQIQTAAKLCLLPCIRSQRKSWSYIAIKSAPDTYFLRYLCILFRRALSLFKYHVAILYPTNVLTMLSYTSMFAYTFNLNTVEMHMQMWKNASTRKKIIAYCWNSRTPFSICANRMRTISLEDICSLQPLFALFSYLSYHRI